MSKVIEKEIHYQIYDFFQRNQLQIYYCPGLD